MLFDVWKKALASSSAIGQYYKVVASVGFIQHFLNTSQCL